MSREAVTPKKTIRCAIYTRKSTSEGLDSDFTSLDAQREAAENYIASQRSEGWVALPDRYDDGGYTGANMDRPALQKLLADLKEGQVDCVVVYKVDRLSRSLTDFVRILETFERCGATFVSVTQAFNTSTSMGRLTLNILLSFAQFERELISERTRDKMAAARKRGKWIGGRPILGYDLDRENQRLVVNAQEAELVREIFALYLKERSLLAVATVLNQRGIKTKRHVSRSGRVFGGTDFTKVSVQTIVSSVLYLGKVEYKGELYPGLQDPLISEEVYRQAQEVLKENRLRPLGSRNARNIGLLSQLLRCKACNSVMIHTYTHDSKEKRRKYRYYVCLSAQKKGYQTCPTRSVNAAAIEKAAVDCVRKLAKDPVSQEKRIQQFQDQLKVELTKLAEQQGTAQARIEKLTLRITELKELRQQGKDVGRDLDKLKEQLQVAEREASALRIQQFRVEEQLLNHDELGNALAVTAPIWDTLFPQEQRRVLRFLLKEVDYDARDGKLALTLSGKGIKLLSEEVAQ